MAAEKSSSSHIQEPQRLGQWLPWAVLVVSLIVTYLMWNNEQQNSTKGLQVEFDFHVRDTDSRIEQRMKAYEQILHGTQSAFFTFNSMGRSEFHAYVSNLNLEKNYPGISGVSFALVVPAAQKAKHIASIRKEGFPKYTIFPDGVREIYTPVIYFEPFSGRNLKAFGHDPYSDPGRRATMERARDSADAAITSKIKLVQESGKDIQAGVIMHMPVYKFGVPHDTLSQRRANILGWVSAVFRMNDLMRGILGERSADLAIKIYDGEEISEQALMYESGNNRHTDAKPHSRFQSTQHMEIAGHPWTMVLSSLPDFDAKLDKGKSRLIGYAGIGTAILLALFTWLLVRGREQALQAAREIARELTERKRLENELRHAIKQQQAREEELRAANQRAEEANRRLQSSESRYRVVYENAPVAFIVSNPEYLIIDWNRAAQTIFGWSREEALGRHLFDLLVPKDMLPEVKGTVDETLNQQVTTHRENWNLTKSGERILCEWSNAQYTDESGTFVGVLSLGMNITERRQLEENIRLEKEKYRDLFDNANDLLFTTDLNEIFTSANHEMLKVSGYTKDELLGQPVSKILTQDTLEIVRGKMAAKINGEAAHTNYHLEVLAKDGHAVPVEINSRLIYESGKPTGIQGIARDISVQLRREAELHAAHQEAEEAARIKSRFLAAAGHDLRQPLAAANLLIGTLKFTKPSSNQSEIIGRIEGAMSNFNGLLNALLNISKLESGAIEPEYKPVAVIDIAQWLKQSFTPMAEESGLVLKLRFPMENLVLHSDYDLVKQVLGNLVSNAFKYTSKGTILVTARRRGTAVLFQVWDTGIGIEADQFEHIFEGFYQINNPQSDSENGLGLGLAIVKRSLALLGVDITCRSQFGRGSVFGFSLPLDDTGQAPQPVLTPAHDEVEIATFARGKRFVVLENDRRVAQGISSLLQAMGGEVKLFTSAEDALRCAETETADFYICDYMLDGALNGLQFLNQLRQKLGTPIHALLMSGDTSPAFAKEIKNCAWPVLSKPVNTSSLISCLNVQASHAGGPHGMPYILPRSF